MHRTNLKVGDRVRASDAPGTTPEPGYAGNYVSRAVASCVGTVEQVDDTDSVHLVLFKFADGSRTKAWIHEAHLTPVTES
jgi:hypothetical protein